MMRTAYGGGRLGGGESSGRSSFSSDGSRTPDWLPPPSAPTRAPRSGEGGEPPEGSVFNRLYSDAKNRAVRDEKDPRAGARSPGRSPRSPGTSPRSPWSGGGSFNSSRSSMSSRTSLSSARTNQSSTGGVKVRNRSKKQTFVPNIRGVLKSGGDSSRADLPPDAKVHFGDFSMVQYPKDEELQHRYTVFWDAIQAKMKEAYRQQNRVKQGLAKQQAEKSQDSLSRRSSSPGSNLVGEDCPYDELAKDVMMTVRTMPLEEEQTLSSEEEGRLMAVPLSAKSAEWWRIWNEEFDKEEDRLVAPRVWDYVFEKGSPKSSL